MKKVKAFFRWIWGECRDWRTVVLLVVVAAAFYTPVWLGYLLWLIFDWNWALVMATAVLVFWVGPFTPFIPICIALTLGIKKWWETRKQKKTAGQPKADLPPDLPDNRNRAGKPPDITK